MESNNARLKNKNKKNNEYKSRKMNKKNRLFFLCFRPTTLDGPVKRSPCPDGPSKPAFTYFAHVGGKEGMVFPKILPSDLAPDIDKEEGDGGRREKSATCKLSRILKAVLTGSSLRRAKRKRSSERNLGQSSSFRLETSNSMKEFLANKQNNLSDDEKLIVNSRCYSAPFTSTGPSLSLPRRCNSFRSNSPAGPEQRQQQDNAQKHGNGGYGFNGVLCYCLLVICLLVLVFWGKIVAIFCTSTWFYLVPRSTRYVSPEDGKEFSGIAFEKYKQKVTMEGRANPFGVGDDNGNRQA